MLQKFSATNQVDSHGDPAGGIVQGTGLDISWQNGPLGRGQARKQPNGAFVETVIAAVKQRLEFYQEARGGKFACEENRSALECLERALAHLNRRTESRERREVEGTHKP